MLEQSISDHEHFSHVRIIIGMVLGISVSRLVIGVSDFLQHSGRRPVYLIHLGWVLYIFITIIHFWWYEFYLVNLRVWSFGIYFFLISFSCLFVFISSMLFPTSMQDYTGYEDYFQSRRKTFYVMFALLAIFDVLDTMNKGIAHFHELGYLYLIQSVAFLFFSLVAIFVSAKIYQMAFISSVLIFKISTIISISWILN